MAPIIKFKHTSSSTLILGLLLANCLFVYQVAFVLAEPHDGQNYRELNFKPFSFLKGRQVNSEPEVPLNGMNSKFNQAAISGKVNSLNEKLLKDLIFKENLLNVLSESLDSNNNNNKRLFESDYFDTSNDQAILNELSSKQDGPNIVMEKRERSKACSFNAINCHRNFQLS